MVDQLKALELYGKAMGYFGNRRGMAGFDAVAGNISIEFVRPSRPAFASRKRKRRCLTACGTRGSSSALNYSKASDLYPGQNDWMPS